MHIFAGFANGCVAYWDVSSVSNINRFIIDGLPHYVPLNFFYTREKNVRGNLCCYKNKNKKFAKNLALLKHFQPWRCIMTAQACV